MPAYGWRGGVGAAAAPGELFERVGRSVRPEDFLIRQHRDAQQELYDLSPPQLRSGQVLDGFDRTVEAFLGVLAGVNTGKMLVRI
ncbi:hypothetical protein HUT16_28630 [Kitasatospora sp. NA04385]|uniref:hypothetical protein n=1 Tax=Kitasatospora sp. NA04385 TaxID=2742135 RepID=UPI001590091E|nr:hypothetical protein [Kitasatospora sp. NA04385]QKW22519.1 hypothetical protein HUT16_28630 [Kitasatospora sp. NA04385]